MSVGAREHPTLGGSSSLTSGNSSRVTTPAELGAPQAEASPPLGSPHSADSHPRGWQGEDKGHLDTSPEVNGG